MSKKIRGFQLLELLVTLSIVGILAAVCLPLYSQHLVKTHRLEAAAMLTKLSIALEQYQFAHNSYQGATLQVLDFPEYIVKNFYRLSILAANETEYEIVAQPLDQQAEKDLACATLTLNALQEKGITGTGNVDACW